MEIFLDKLNSDDKKEAAKKWGKFENIHSAKHFWDLLLRPNRYASWPKKGLVVFLGLGFYYVFGVDGILYAIGLSYVGYTLLVYRGMKNEKLNFPLFKQHVGFISNNYSYGFTQIISSQIDKILIPIFISFSILGNYALGLQVIAVLNILPQIVYKLILPYDASGESNSKLKIITIFSSIGLSSLS